MNRNIVFISTIIPSDYGARPKVVMNYLKQLSITFGYQITLVIISDNQVIPKLEWLHQIIIIRQPSIYTQLYNILCNSIVRRKAPFQSYLYWSKILDAKVKTIVQKVNPLVTIFEMIRTILYGNSIKTPKLLDLADLLSRRYKQQLSADNPSLRLAGQYEKGYSKVFTRLINVPAIKKYILQQEYILTKKSEIDSAKSFDLVSLVSLKEIKMVSKYSRSNNVIWIPNGVDPAQNQSNIIVKYEKIFSFVGVLDNPHNEQGVLFFLKSIFPYIIMKIPEIKFQIIGRNPTRNIIQAAKKYYSNVIILGNVSSVEIVLSKSMLTIVPLQIGSGVKTKIFESLKFGIPVVSTTIGAEGIVPAAYKSILIRDTPQGFANACIRLVSDLRYNKELGKAGKTVVQEYYSWKYPGNILHKRIEDLARNI